jgi:integrase
VESQAVLAPWLLGCGPDEQVFTSARSEAKRQREWGEARETPRFPSHMARNEKKRVGSKRRRPPSDRPFGVGALGLAIARACAKAGVRSFCAYQLRHLRATELREKFGMEACRAVLGHSFAAMSDRYSQHADAALASRVAQ